MLRLGDNSYLLEQRMWRKPRRMHLAASRAQRRALLLCNQAVKARGVVTEKAFLQAQRAPHLRVMYSIGAAGVVARLCYRRCCQRCVLTGKVNATARVLGEGVLAGASPRAIIMLTFLLALDAMFGHVFCSVIVCDTSVRRNLEPKMFQNLVPKISQNFHFRSRGILVSGVCAFRGLRVAEQGQTKRGAATRGNTKQGKARQGKAGQRKARQGNARQSNATQGTARHGRRDNTLASLWVHFGFTLGSLWLHVGFTLSSLWVHFGFTLASL